MKTGIGLSLRQEADQRRLCPLCLGSQPPVSLELKVEKLQAIRVRYNYCPHCLNPTPELAGDPQWQAMVRLYMGSALESLSTPKRLKNELRRCCCLRIKDCPRENADCRPDDEAGFTLTDQTPQ